MRDYSKSPKFRNTFSEQPKHQLTVRLPQGMIKKIEQEAEKSGISLAGAVREYIERGLKQ